MTPTRDAQLPIIAVLDFGGVPPGDLHAVVRAVNGQIIGDFLPIWKKGRILEVLASAFNAETMVEPPPEPISASGIIYLVRVATLKAALGYHDRNAHHLPVGFVLVEDKNWSINLSHQTLEMIIDPMASSFVAGPDPYSSDAPPVLWAYDICEPVEDTAYFRDGVLVANFVTPAYFETEHTQAVSRDFLSIGLPPFGVSEGGQTSFVRVDTGTWETRSGFSVSNEGHSDVPNWNLYHHPKPRVLDDSRLEAMLAEYNKNPPPGCRGFSNPLYSITRLFRYMRLTDHRLQPTPDQSTTRPADGSATILDARLAKVSRTKDERVHFSVTCARSVQAGNNVIIDVWAHLLEQRDHVVALAREQLDRIPLMVKTKGPIPVEHGSIVTVQLSIPTLNVREPEDTILWEGELGSASFVVAVSPDAAQGLHAGTAYCRIRGLLIAKTVFALDVVNARTEREVFRAGATTPIYETAFASYAQEDRDAVLQCVQGIQKIAPQLQIFLDVVSLRSGQNWKQALEQAISTKDVLYLFWSAASKASEWVQFEWQLALRKRGIEFIDPIPLVSPDLVPPPKELSSLHFNDWTLAFRSASPQR